MTSNIWGAALGAMLMIQPATAASTILAEEWDSYRTAYISEAGRIVDYANNSISHSEGQGYGLILSVLAGDRATFERVWKFTETELMVRDDGLAAWRWEPEADPRVTDPNNATDGDMLIAYGLVLAGHAWNEQAYLDRATSMVRTIGHDLLTAVQERPVILPGAVGFVSEETGAVVLNPSYWVFETIPVFAQLDPTINWNAVTESGLDILARAAETRTGIPADWVVLEGDTLVPAENFPPEFGYNGIRIPLYLMRAGLDPSYLEPFLANSDASGLRKIDVVTGAVLEPISEPGYRLIEASMKCTLTNQPIPAELAQMQATSYYAATLQLLLLDHLRRERPDCLEKGPL
ncbi:MAG: endoglucanase [Devosia sp.]|uniref:glycosyl hydrolase family 8 n=1 Tax=Devosia sp. TaxID=1871048 RepID=UPI0019F9D34D|nr:glycosyl hydrolase family 8 [Devosia sp.]MBF0680792.1 endoglucanase [Devosia sp.]